jgi:molybdopterin synthase sulfur carrier subunit
VRIEVRLFANLAGHLPDESAGATTLEVPEGTTVEDLLARLAIPDELPRLVVVNGRDPAPRQPLVPGDVVSILPPLVGG